MIARRRSPFTPLGWSAGGLILFLPNSACRQTTGAAML